MIVIARKFGLGVIIALSLSAWLSEGMAAEDIRLVPGGWARPLRMPDPAPAGAEPPGGPAASVAPTKPSQQPVRRRVIQPRAPARPAPPADGKVQF